MHGVKSVNTRAIKKLKGSIDKKRSQISKAPPGGRAEIKNDKTTILTFSISALSIRFRI